MSLEFFKKPGKASFLMGGQWGSEGKGSCAAYLATHLAERRDMFDIVTTNAGAQAGHTSTHEGKTKVVFHLPTAALYPYFAAPGDAVPVQPLTYLNAGSIIDPDGLLRELDENPNVARKLMIHPNAAIITQECRDAEMREDSAQTKIASTRKGVGEALSRKVLRSGVLAKDLDKWSNYIPWARLSRFVGILDLNEHMMRGSSVLVEVPQGHSLSLDGPFYPHVTSRNCTVMQAMSDAGIHPNFYYQSMLVIRTMPIRVGSLSEDNHSGGCFSDQYELTWEEIGVKPEITTVTKRQRRIFTISEQQIAEAIAATRPSVIFLSFCDYLKDEDVVKRLVERLKILSKKHGLRNACPEILCGWGPSTSDVRVL